MLSILLAVLPVFLILGAGYGTVRSGYLPDDLAAALNAFAIRVAIPCLLFRSMLELDFSVAFVPPVLTAFYAGALISFALGYVAARRLFDRPPDEAVAVGFGCTFSNTLLLGLPIVERVYGAGETQIVFGIISIHTPALYTVGMMAMELTHQDGRTLGRTLTSAVGQIFANPLMIGICLGIAANLTGLVPPGFLMAAIDILAPAAIPAALFGIGATLSQYKLKSDLAESLTVSAISLLVHPTIAYLIGRFAFDLPANELAVVTVVAAMSPGTNIYIFAAMYDRAVRLAASAVLIGTGLAIVTVTGWIWLLSHLP